MDQRDERAPRPGARLAGYLGGLGDAVCLDPSERGQRNAAESGDDRRLDEIERALKERSAASALAGERTAVARGFPDLAEVIERIAEDGVGDEHPGTVKRSGGEERGEALTGSVTLERHAGSRGAEPAGRLTDDDQPCVERSVRGTEDMLVRHPLAAEAVGNLADDGREARWSLWGSRFGLLR